VRAGSSDRKVVLPAPHQDRVFVIDAAFDDGALRNILNGNAGSKIQLISLFHAVTPLTHDAAGGNSGQTRARLVHFAPKRASAQTPAQGRRQLALPVARAELDNFVSSS
jgi:hypothetical protein